VRAEQRTVVLAVACGLLAELGILLAVRAAGDTAAPALLLLVLEAIVLGFVFGPRVGMVAAALPIVVFAAIDSFSCEGECSRLWILSTYVVILLGFCAGLTGALRVRYGRRGRAGRPLG
jgi:hypothetical protein